MKTNKINTTNMITQQIKIIINKTLLFLLSAIFVFALQEKQVLYAQGFSQESSQEKNAYFYKQNGDQFLIQKKTLLALEEYRKSLLQNPNYVPALTAMAKILRQAGDNRQALEKIEKAYKLEPKNQNVLLEKAEIFLQILDAKKAQATAEEGLQLAPQKPDFHFVLTKVYLLKGNVALAQNKAEKLIRSHPNFAAAYIVMGDILTEQKRFEKALEYYRKARLIEPDNPTIFVQMSVAEIKKTLFADKNALQKANNVQVFENAIRDLQSARAFDGDHVESNFILGKIYALTGDCSRALPYLAKVTQVNPSHQGALSFISYCKPQNSVELLGKLLYQNQNDDLLRFSYEWSTLRAFSRREHPANMSNVRYHLNNAKFLLSANYLEAAYELRWAEFLNPDYVITHKMLLDHYRNIRDYQNYLVQLNYLRQREANQKNATTYQDRFEQYMRERSSHVYYRAGIQKPQLYKSKTPVFIFFPTAQEPFASYPFAGLALAESISFQLQAMGKVAVADYAQRQKIYGSLNPNGVSQGIVYNSQNVARLTKVFPVRSVATTYNAETKIPPAFPLRYVMNGSFKKIANGIEVSVYLVDLQTGKTFAPYSVRASGRGYLRKIAMSVATHIYKNLPMYGYIIKINNYDITINLGKKDGIKKDQQFDVIRNKQVVARVKILRLGMDVSIVRAVNEADIFSIQNGDALRVYNPPKK